MNGGSVIAIILRAKLAVAFSTACIGKRRMSYTVSFIAAIRGAWIEVVCCNRWMNTGSVLAIIIRTYQAVVCTTA
jgi:hypothetical protein